jgi:beta-glucosidase
MIFYYPDKVMIKSVLGRYAVMVVFFLFTLLASAQGTGIDEKVDSLLNLMTLEEKIGQMTQVERSELENINDIATYGLGSLLSGGGSAPSPNTRSAWANMYDNFQSIALQSNRGIPILYGVDAVHGHNNVYGAVIFPHNIGMGCTWNPDLVKTVNQVVALEVAATGVDWTFSPCIAVPRNERWGRTYEGFGETPEIQEIMAEASVSGLQGTGLSDAETILACAKHYVGDGGTTDGIDQGNTELWEGTLREIHMAGYIDAIEAGVGSIMASYNSWNGEKLHGSGYLLTDVLKNELGFEGFIVSDWKGVDQLDGDYREAIKKAINAGIDMVMVPDQYIVFIGHLLSLVEDGEVSVERIDDAVSRILKQKFLLNLFDEPYTDGSLATAFGSVEHREVARQAVRESMVLLNAKNDVLPLQKNDQTIMVAGSLATDLGAQCGGWTISWQGSNGNITQGTDILTGIQNLAAGSEVIYSPFGAYDGPVDVAVVVIGEKSPYAEGAGDRTSLNIDVEDISLLKKIKEKGIPVIALLVSGRPLIISELLTYSDAIIAVWYPGSEGEGIAEVLFGDFEPSGQLTHTWPKEMDQIPINIGDYYYDPLFEYKHGLQYFPEAAASENLLPYAASTSTDGNTIMLALTDKVTSLNYETNDFEIIVNDAPVPDLVNNVSLAAYDESILVIDLESPVEEMDDIVLSYSGNGIASDGLILAGINGYYVCNKVGVMEGKNVIPGRVEAEDYFDMFGVQTEPCSDIGGGLNVGYIEAGDWMKYDVEVTQSGLFRMTCRISGFVGGVLKITFNDSIQALVNYSSTDGWQNWQDFNTDVSLGGGTYEMKITAQSEGFNINYYDFELISGIHDNDASIHDITVYPNPVTEEVNLSFTNSLSRSATIKLIDLTGKYAQVLREGKIEHGKNTFRFSIDPDLPPGLYFIEIKDESRRYFLKVIKE